jgi:sugar phosphate isomerase/epimerase
MTRSISLAALTVLELTPPEMVDCAAEAGFSHVGIRLFPATPTEPQYDIVGDTPLLREVEHRLADTGVKVLDVEIFRIKPLAEARGERLFPGEGGVGLVGLVRALPRDLPLSLEVPTLTLAKTVDATERARRALAATKRVLAQLDNDSTTATRPSPSRKG